MGLLEKLKYINFHKKKERFILSFIGSILFGFTLFPSIGIGQSAVYITSYFHYKQINIDMQYSNLILPVQMFCQSLFSPLGGLIEKKIGLYLSLIISFLLIELDLFIFINQTNILLSFILIIFLGLGQGIGMGIPGKNLLFYYPKKTGIIRSIIGSTLMLCGASYGVITEKIINPKKYTLQKGEQFYPLEISQNFIKMYKYILIINPLFIILSLLLIKKYDIKYENELVQENNNNENKILLKEENYSKNIKSAIFNRRFWRIIGILLLSPFVMNFSRNTFRVYGALASFNGGVMQYSGLFTGFSNIIVGPIWGYINDKYKFKIIIKILLSCIILQAILFSIFIKSNIIYLICILFGSIIVSGFMTASSLHILRVYGIKYSLEIGGIANIFGGIFNILISLLSFIISKFYHTGEELQFIYRFVYIAGIFIIGIGFILSFYENEDIFIYPSYEKNKDKYLTMSNSSDLLFNENEKTEIPSKEIELVLDSNSSEITTDSIDSI